MLESFKFNLRKLLVYNFNHFQFSLLIFFPLFFFVQGEWVTIFEKNREKDDQWHYVTLPIPHSQIAQFVFIVHSLDGVERRRGNIALDSIEVLHGAQSCNCSG